MQIFVSPNVRHSWLYKCWWRTMVYFEWVTLTFLSCLEITQLLTENVFKSSTYPGKTFQLLSWLCRCCLFFVRSLFLWLKDWLHHSVVGDLQMEFSSLVGTAVFREWVTWQVKVKSDFWRNWFKPLTEGTFTSGLRRQSNLHPKVGKWLTSSLDSQSLDRRVTLEKTDQIKEDKNHQNRIIMKVILVLLVSLAGLCKSCFESVPWILY